jgi:glutamate synthase domain-containing protein 2
MTPERVVSVPIIARKAGDLIWEIGSGYFGCRNRDGSFNPDEFARVKVSQGAKPGHSGVLPAAKVSEEISKIRGVAIGEDCISPATHRAFSTPLEMMIFIGQMRRRYSSFASAIPGNFWRSARP